MILWTQKCDSFDQKLRAQHNINKKYNEKIYHRRIYVVIEMKKEIGSSYYLFSALRV